MTHVWITFRCTPETPWTDDVEADVILHPQAREIGEQVAGYPAGDIVTMRCPTCGYTWEKELPQ